MGKSFPGGFGRLTLFRGVEAALFFNSVGHPLPSPAMLRLHVRLFGRKEAA